MENFQHFREILLTTLKSNMPTWTIVLCLMVILLVCNIASYKKTGADFALWRKIPAFKYTKSKLSVKEQISMQSLALVVVLVIIGVKTIPVLIDISKEQYISCHASYERYYDDSDSGGIFSEEYVQVNIDGEVLRLKLPGEAYEAEFPEGSCEGQVCYSEASKYILSFQPDR